MNYIKHLYCQKIAISKSEVSKILNAMVAPDSTFADVKIIRETNFNFERDYY